MMNRVLKSTIAVTAMAAMSLGTLAACGNSSASSNGKGKVYLKFKTQLRAHTSRH